ncbi:hypothetical protein KEM56_001689 [Ascosphaera pollenicola]|nr:hypothetical protein KEM56_001689 [Ascosphaera pollenicola]
MSAGTDMDLDMDLEMIKQPSHMRSLFAQNPDSEASLDPSDPSDAAAAAGGGGGVLRRLRRGSLRHPTPSTTGTSSADYQPAAPSLSEQTDQQAPENDSSSLSTTPTLGATGLSELDPVIRFLQAQSTRLYQEGYLLKLDDLDINGQPSPKRDWVEYFVQLTGTILAFWSAERDGNARNTVSEAPALYMNLADASIKIIDSLPTNSPDASLRNVLSISTAGHNRFLLHFGSVNALTQWAAAIRLSIYEYTLLQESYTGALIAGKGKTINGLRQLLGAPTKWSHGEWVRVRFRPGTPWVRRWCVIEPPSEKETAKLQKAAKRQNKSRSIYDRSSDLDIPRAKGCVVFYENKKAMKKPPIARVADAWMAYVVYPRGLALIDHSTLIKVHGTIETPANPNDHSSKDKKGAPRVASEGCVFILPEARPAVAGYEILLRFLIPLYDTFSLYGRPTRLIADTNNARSLMFALNRNRLTIDGCASVSSHGSGLSRGYLDLLDVSSLIHTKGSQSWSEQEWMRNLKNVTAKKMSLHTSAVANNEPTLPDVAFLRPEEYSRSPIVQHGSPIRPIPPHNHHRSISENITQKGMADRGARYGHTRNRIVTVGHAPADYTNDNDINYTLPEQIDDSASGYDANHATRKLASGSCR